MVSQIRINIIKILKIVRGSIFIKNIIKTTKFLLQNIRRFGISDFGIMFNKFGFIMHILIIPKHRNWILARPHQIIIKLFDIHNQKYFFAIKIGSVNTGYYGSPCRLG